MQQRGMNIYEACPHCGQRMNVINLSRHVEKCIEGPFGERIFAFIVSISHDGVIPTRQEYDTKRPKEYPSGKLLGDWLGGWKQLAPRLGLAAKKQKRDYTPRLTRIELREEFVNTWCNAVVAHENRIREKDAERAQKFPVMHEWRERIYNVGPRTYRELYTVLR